MLLLFACADPPQELPTAEAAEASVDRDALPPLYRKLYDYAFLPQVQAQEQRVRLRIWLRHMEFNAYQLGLLEELAARSRREFEEVENRQRQIVTAHEPQIAAVYDQLWNAMDRGAGDEELGRIGEGLDQIHLREAELLELRAKSVRTVLEAEQPFLQTLTPAQETKFADAIFALRHRLDPYANPGDFNALIGSVYVTGEFGALTRPTFDPNEDHLNIGGLWSPNPEALTGPYFQAARREVVLYMLLLEPTLPAAILAVREEKPAAGLPTAPAPGVPTPPEPAPPGAPQPGPAGVPSPAPPGSPGPGIPTEPAPGVPTEPPPR